MGWTNQPPPVGPQRDTSYWARMAEQLMPGRPRPAAPLTAEELLARVARLREAAEREQIGKPPNHPVHQAWRRYAVAEAVIATILEGQE